MTNKEELKKILQNLDIKQLGLKNDGTGRYDYEFDAQKIIDFIEQIRKSDMERVENSIKVYWGNNIYDGVSLGEVLSIIKQDTPCKHVSDGLSYTSNPPQSRCIECGSFYR